MNGGVEHPLYSKDGKEIFLVHDEEKKDAYRFLLKEDDKEQKSGMFDIAQYSCFWYSKYE